MSATEDAIALLRSRVEYHRIGRSTWREIDHDIVAMRKAIELLEHVNPLGLAEEPTFTQVEEAKRHHWHAATARCSCGERIRSLDAQIRHVLRAVGSVER